MKKILLFIIIVLSVLIWACNKEEILLTENIQLTFSTDTLRFDTVFAELGSATRILKVYNKENQRIRIDRIAIESNSGISFRMNVDGIAGKEVLNVEIPARDSLYIFAEVTVDPDQDVSVSPFVGEGRIVFETKDNRQEITLEAWGQNANYLPSRFAKGTFSVVGDFTMNDPKPYVIYGGLFVERGTLTIPAGARVHVHGGLARNENFIYNDGFIWVLGTGCIKVEGTLENPVIIQGNRLEKEFKEVSGQWTGIFIDKNSKGNKIEHATIKNSRFGIYVDSAATLVANHAQFYNTASSGIIGVHSTINLTNCLLYNNGFHAIQLVHGGDYQFDYCTVASYGVDASALRMTNSICYVPEGIGCRLAGTYRLNARFRNSIFFGSKSDEILLEDAIKTREGLNYTFENCVVRVNKLLENTAFPNFFDFCINCPKDLNSNSKLFIDSGSKDYRLDSLSVALNLATPLSNVTLDLLGKPRDAVTPDAGCFERE